MKDKCPICGGPKRSESKTCRSCYSSGINRGENSINWKGGKPKCRTCGKILNDYTSEFCHKCYHLQNYGEKNSNWKGGKPRCAVCGKELSDYVSTYCKKCSNQLARNPNWKGGEAKHGSGYIQVKCPEHPNANRRGYILKHRLVMSEHLGRALKEDELVHHIDGNKLNNDIKNLQLVTSKAKESFQIVQNQNHLKDLQIKKNLKNLKDLRKRDLKVIENFQILQKINHK